LSFDEMKRKRAERFGIPVTSPDAKKETKIPSAKKQKSEQTKGGETKEPAADEELLSREEIEKRIARAEKFGTQDTAKIDMLKAQLRRHRFNEANA
jgi:hypothetical protein